MGSKSFEVPAPDTARGPSRGFYFSPPEIPAANSLRKKMAGRPSFKPTAAMKRKVIAAKAGGMSEDHIALALGITRPTLRKHFELELTTGASQKRMDALDALFSQVRKGNVAAIKTALLLNDGGDVLPGAPKPAGDETPATAAPAPAARLGKKEAAQMAARSAADGTDWDGLLPAAKSIQ